MTGEGGGNLDLRGGGVLPSHGNLGRGRDGRTTYAMMA
jgi:hypothetical protein